MVFAESAKYVMVISHPQQTPWAGAGIIMLKLAATRRSARMENSVGR
jgi:hypothetical protein